MYYAYNSFTGRLIGAHHLRAYAPQGLQPLRPGEPINPYPPTWTVAHATSTTAPKQAVTPSTPVARTTAASAPLGQRKTPSGEPFGKVPERLKQLQIKFQKPDGVPIHLKGGPMDKGLYFVTLGLCLVGVIGCMHTVYKFGFPQKPSE